MLRELFERAPESLQGQVRDAKNIITPECLNESKTLQEWWEAAPKERKRRITKEIEIGFAYGKFDEWCVYVCRDEQDFYWFIDNYYFGQIHVLSGKSSAGITPDMLYKDLKRIYYMQLKNAGRIDDNILRYIRNITAKYGEYKEDALLWFSVIYFAMIAEENKKNAIIGSGIKMVALHDILINHRSVKETATCDVGQNVRTILKKCVDNDIYHPSVYSYLIDEEGVKSALNVINTIDRNTLSKTQNDALDFIIKKAEKSIKS